MGDGCQVNEAWRLRIINIKISKTGSEVARAIPGHRRLIVEQGAAATSTRQRGKALGKHLMLSDRGQAQTSCSIDDVSESPVYSMCPCMSLRFENRKKTSKALGISPRAVETQMRTVSWLGDHKTSKCSHIVMTHTPRFLWDFLK